MKKVVYNACHGGFSLSKIATMWLAARGLEEAVAFLAEQETDGSTSWERFCFYPTTLARHASLLVECVETLGPAADGDMSKLATATVDGLYRIEDYDGYESVVCPHHIVWNSTNDPDIIDETGKEV